jgi:hypothetical protein
MSDVDTEKRILSVTKATLVRIIKETTTKPELKHPLSDDVRMMMRECLELITLREYEFEKSDGKAQSYPHFVDEPQSTVSVSVDKIQKKQ